MINFEVTGFTKGTKRRRHQIISASTQSAASAIADSRNIEVTSIQPVPEEHASEAQLNYAFALGISCPPDATKDELSALIQSHLDNAEDPLDLLIDLARKHRIAEIRYWKYGEPRATIRLVEPYDLVGSSHEVRAVHCFQIDPPPTDRNPWRTFNLVNIKSVLDAGNSFDPRRSGTLLTGQLVPYESVQEQELSGGMQVKPKATANIADVNEDFRYDPQPGPLARLVKAVAAVILAGIVAFLVGLYFYFGHALAQQH
jgi:hypothetical protein